MPALLRVAWTHMDGMDAVDNVDERIKQKRERHGSLFLCVLHNALGSREGCPYRFLFRYFL